MFVKFLVTFYLGVDLKFEISDGKNLVNIFGGRTFLPARKARESSERISGQISEQISGKFSETSFQFLGLLFRNFVQQKGGANQMCPKITALMRTCSKSLHELFPAS